MQTTTREPRLLRRFEFAFAGILPSSIFREGVYNYVAELVREGEVIISPASRFEETVSIIDVTGMSMTEVHRWFDHPEDCFRLAKAGELVEIAEKHQDIQKKGRFYAAGESWPWRQKERLFLFLDNELPNFATGRASHIDPFGPRDYIDQSLGNGLKAFVAVIGDCPRLGKVVA